MFLEGENDYIDHKSVCLLQKYFARIAIHVNSHAKASPEHDPDSKIKRAQF